MKIKILKKDFDKAVSQPWSHGTCLLQQAVKREGYGGDMFDLAVASPEAGRAMVTFDDNFCEPKDRNKPAMQKLRASLPITVEIADGK